MHQNILNYVPVITSVSQIYDSYNHNSFCEYYQNIKNLSHGLLAVMVILNLHLKLSKLILEAVESNPGPHSDLIRESVLATYYHRRQKYARSAGMQCTGIDYFSFLFSVKNAPTG